MGGRFRNRRCFVPKTAPEAPKTPPRGPQTAQKAPKMLPRCLPATELGMILYLADLMLKICIKALNRKHSIKNSILTAAVVIMAPPKRGPRRAPLGTATAAHTQSRLNHEEPAAELGCDAPAPELGRPRD